MILPRRPSVRSTLGVLFALLAVAAGCRRASPKLPPVMGLNAFEAALTRRSLAPDRFKMVHQVAISFRDERHVITGLMLGERDGDFLLSASAALGPRLFDLRSEGGQVSAQVHLSQLEGKLDPRHLARAISRIYFADCDPSTGKVLADQFVYRCAFNDGGDDVDALEARFDRQTNAPTHKTFSRKGQAVLEVDYREPTPYGQEWLPKRIDYQHAYGVALRIALIEYERRGSG